MRETIKVPETIERDVVVKLECDRCGKDILLIEETFRQLSEGVRFSLDFGFGSVHDLETWSFDICDSCAEWLRDEMTHNPVVTGRTYLS